MFTAAAAYMLLESEPEALGLLRYVLWIALVACPALAFDALERLLRHAPTILATDEGLVFRSILGVSDPIPWPRIAEFRSVIMGKRPFLAVYLHDPVAVFAGMRLATRLMHARSHSPGVPNFTFRAIQIGVPPSEAAEALEKLRRQRAGR
jgi:hypothetical protein